MDDIFDFSEPFDFYPIKITLNSGIETQLKGFHLSMTYGGVMEGAPGKELNELTIEMIQGSKKFGDRKLFLSQVGELDLDKPLPYFSCFAWLSSYGPANDIYADGSEMVIHWFENSIQDRPIAQIIEEAVKNLNWEKEADDFWY